MECVCSVRRFALFLFKVSAFWLLGLCSVPCLGTVRSVKVGDTLQSAFTLDSNDIASVALTETCLLHCVLLYYCYIILHYIIILVFYYVMILVYDINHD